MHYPEQRTIAKLTVIQRQVTLPEQASGLVTVLPDQRVDVRDVVARGLVPGEHIIVDAQEHFRLRKPGELEPLLQVRVDDEVDEVTVLAGRTTGRSKPLYSPVRGRVSAILDGKIMIEQQNDVIDLEAGVRGRVSEVVSGRGALIEATGAQAQGFWGNGRRSIAVVRGEGNRSLELLEADAVASPFAGAIVALRRMITEPLIHAARSLSVAGLIAPSMEVDLIEMALAQPFPILITEAFGEARMGRTLNQWLQDLEGSQITLDAYQPQVWESRRPEIVMNVVPKAGEVPSRPNLMLTMRPGLNVRVIGEPHTGMSATVVNLPSDPILLDNGMRFPCALVELSSSERVFVPLTNLEVTGR